MKKYIVLCGQIVGNERDGFTCSYDWDYEKFNTKEEAIKHGFEIRESDDFNVGEVEEKKLVAKWWMDEKLDEPEETLKEIAKSIGL